MFELHRLEIWYNPNLWLKTHEWKEMLSSLGYRFKLVLRVYHLEVFDKQQLVLDTYF